MDAGAALGGVEAEAGLSGGAVGDFGAPAGVEALSLRALIRRARSIRMRLMASAAAPKKCARFCHVRSPSPTSRSQASWTSAVGWSVWPAASCAMRAAASRRNSS